MFLEKMKRVHMNIGVNLSHFYNILVQNVWTFLAYSAFKTLSSQSMTLGSKKLQTVEKNTKNC
jgi:hypothetical protein